MNTVHIKLHVNNAPVIIEMMSPRVQTQQFKWDAYGQTHSNRLILSNDTMLVCLYLDDALTKRQMERLAEAYKRKMPPAVRLGNPIKAIHYIEAGQGWPLDEHSEPRSILNCLPDEEWAGMANRPPVVAQHPLLNQPADIISFQCRMSAGMPAAIHYDSIAEVAQIHDVVKIRINPFDNAELIGLAIVFLKDEAAAAELAESLRLRRVKRISSNELVVNAELYPKPGLCRGKDTLDIGDGHLCASFGQHSLWHFICKSDPDCFAEDLRHEDDRTATNDGPGVQGAAGTPPALPVNSTFTVPALQALTVNA